MVIRVAGLVMVACLTLGASAPAQQGDGGTAGKEPAVTPTPRYLMQEFGKLGRARPSW